MNTLHVGFTRTVRLPTGGWLLIDAPPAIRNVKVFDPHTHSFNPLSEMTYRKACDIVDIFDALFPRGDGTLTKDTGLDFIAEALEARPASLDRLIPKPLKNATTGQIWAYSKVRRILRSPVLRRVLANPNNLDFKPLNNPRAKIAARLDRAELGNFDALVLGLFLMAHYKGQLVVPDFGFYGRDVHESLILEERLVAGVDYLGQLPPKLRQTVLSIGEKIPSGTNYEDAKTLAIDGGHVPGSGPFDYFINTAMS